MPLLRISKYETEKKKRIVASIPIHLYDECQRYSDWVGTKSFNHFVVEALAYIIEKDTDWVTAQKATKPEQKLIKARKQRTTTESVTIPESVTTQESVTVLEQVPAEKSSSRFVNYEKKAADL